MKASYGFTLIELIIVILLLGILSATALPRFMGKAGVEEVTARDQSIALLRLNQTQAMQNTFISSPPFNLVQATSQVLEPDSVLQLRLFDTKASGGNLISGFRFSSLGRPIKLSGSDVYEDGLRLEIQGTISLMVCIESEGYIHPC